MAVETTPERDTGVFSPGRAKISARTLRTDDWRRSPLWIGLILAIFVLYSTVRIFMNKWYYAEPENYLTPVYSPCISASCPEGAADFGTWLPSFPAAIPLAILIFPILAGFRVTCYYYRKIGYRSLWLSPQACGVAEPHRRYTGETRFPLIVMNYHRYFFVLASILLLVNLYDAVKAFFPTTGGFGFGLGTVIMVVNVVALSMYLLTCHSCRHLIGGRLKHFSAHPLRYRMWTFLSRLNPRHGRFAMTSLFTVIFTDFYIMAVSAGWISDLRFVN